MDGMQQTVCEGLHDLAKRVETGEFGEGDEFDIDLIWEEYLDLESLMR